MKADSAPLKTLFVKDIRYVVPLYQRPYVWTREDKWEPLWQDVLNVVRDLGVADANTPPPPHFLGAIVLDSKWGQIADLEVRHIIDGQQRLVTLQLLISAAATVAAATGCEQSANILAGLIENDNNLWTDADHRFKVWPTNVDRPAYRAAMNGGQVTSREGQRIWQAHQYFLSVMAGWAEDLGEGINDGFRLLTRALRDYLRLVVIDLEIGDNAQIIFETLNARTTPLLSIDLIKNLVFRRAEREGENLDELYVTYWSVFDQEQWRREIRQGRLKLPRAEIFLMHWLAMKTADEVSPSRLYSGFQRLLDGPAAAKVATTVEQFHGDSVVYDSFETQPLGTPERTFFDRISALDVSTVFPLLLLVFREDETVLSMATRRRALKALESWLVRRTLCRLTPKNYNRFFTDLVRTVKKDLAHIDEVLIRTLRQGDAPTTKWPSDEELTEALVHHPLYWNVAGARIVMVLAAVEQAFRDPKKAEDLAVPKSLTIEHVLPQRWQEHWPVSEGDVTAESERERHVNRLGNLTLVTSTLNPAMANRAWPEKRKELGKSLLLLNRRLCDENLEIWDEERIDQRSQELSSRIVEIWAGPDSTSWLS